MNKKGYIYLGISILAFSTIEVVSKSIVNDFHPIQMNFLRFFIGGIILLPLAIRDMKKRNIKLSKKDILILVSLGILAVPISMSFFQFSLSAPTNASVLAVLISANPLFVAPFSFFILKEKADKTVIISLILGLLGMGVIAAPSFGAGGSTAGGILLGIIASITFALFTVLGKKLSPRLGGLVLNCMVFFSGSLIMIPFMVMLKIPVFSGINFSNILQLLHLGFIVTAVGYIFLFKGLSSLPANRGTLVFFVKPFLAGGLAFIFFKETISVYLIIGTLLIISGIFITIIKSSQKGVNIKTKAV